MKSMRQDIWFEESDPLSPLFRWNLKWVISYAQNLRLIKKLLFRKKEMTNKLGEKQKHKN